MALTQKTEYDSITILLDGQIQIRRSRVVIDDDGITEISRTYWRKVLEPGEDVSSFPPRVRAICNFIWTPTVIAAYEAAKAARIPLIVQP